jgi:hypothetical protein
MKRATDLPVYERLQAFGQPPGIVTAPTDIQTNLIALGDSTPTRSELAIEGTEPVTPKREEPAEVAADTQGPPEHVILITDHQGRRVYINFGEPGSPGSEHDLRPDGRLAFLIQCGQSPVTLNTQ